MITLAAFPSPYRLSTRIGCSGITNNLIGNAGILCTFQIDREAAHRRYNFHSLSARGNQRGVPLLFPSFSSPPAAWLAETVCPIFKAPRTFSNRDITCRRELGCDMKRALALSETCQATTTRGKERGKRWAGSGRLIRPRCRWESRRAFAWSRIQ